ncbi:MAG TPA: hypothetical protein PKE29_13350 [Phycisphaerales bacterium]|nr:hypothetical protein [Phycisphaerales bacterium]
MNQARRVFVIGACIAVGAAPSLAVAYSPLETGKTVEIVCLAVLTLIAAIATAVNVRSGWPRALVVSGALLTWPLYLIALIVAIPMLIAVFVAILGRASYDAVSLLAVVSPVIVWVTAYSITCRNYLAAATLLICLIIAAITVTIMGPSWSHSRWPEFRFVGSALIGATATAVLFSATRPLRAT